MEFFIDNSKALIYQCMFRASITFKQYLCFARYVHDIRPALAGVGSVGTLAAFYEFCQHQRRIFGF